MRTPLSGPLREGRGEAHTAASQSSRLVGHPFARQPAYLGFSQPLSLTATADQMRTCHVVGRPQSPWLCCCQEGPADGAFGFGLEIFLLSLLLVLLRKNLLDPTASASLLSLLPLPLPASCLSCHCSALSSFLPGTSRPSLHASILPLHPGHRIRAWHR